MIEKKVSNLVSSAKEVGAIAEEIVRAGVVAVDTEFIRETSYFPKMALLQLATQDQTWVLDPLALSAEELKPILAVFTDPGILKIMHAAFADQECLFWTYGVLAEPVIDTAVAGALCGYGDSVGLGKLAKEVLGIRLPKGRARAKWTMRPLSGELLHYAAMDVAYLVEIGEKLKKKLEGKHRWNWALEESRVGREAFEPSPRDMARKMCKGAYLEPEQWGILEALVEWREARAKQANLPRGWVADNDILIALARTRPRTLEDLRSFRGLSAKTVEKSGDAILEAIRIGVSRKAAPGEGAGIERAPEGEGLSQELLKAYLHFLSARHEVAIRYLVQSQHYSRVLMTSPATWRDQEVLSPFAHDLIAQDLEAFLSGKRALTLKNGNVDVFEIV